MSSPALGALPTTLPRDLHEALVEMAMAVQKRAIYPGGHPVLHGAVGRVHNKLAAVLLGTPNLNLGVAERRLMLDGAASDESHPHLSDLAARLAAHHVGGLRFIGGVNADELALLVGGLAASAEGGVPPLALRDDLIFAHITLEPLAFNRLGLLDGDSAAEDPEDATWRALAAAALGEGEGDLLDPAAIAQAINNRDEIAAEILAHIEEMFASVATGRASRRTVERVSTLLSALGEAGIAKLLGMEGLDRANVMVSGTIGKLPPTAAVELLRAAAQVNGAPVSGAMLRLLQKFAGAAREGGNARTNDRLLRLVIRRMLEGWTLESPNPERYEQALATAAVPRGRGPDQRRDAVEPERVIDLAIETGAVAGAAEVALGALVVRGGLAKTIELLCAYPAIDAREQLIDRVLNESTLREHLSQQALDAPLLRFAVDRVQRKAVGPLLDSLTRRGDSDAALLVELLSRVGRDVLEPIGAWMPEASPRVLRHYVAVFDAVGAWPPQVDPVTWARHPEFIVRREAVKHLLKAPATRDTATLLALRDPDARIFAIGLTAVAGCCTPKAAREVMRRFSVGDLTVELRLRAIRTVASSASSEVLAWLLPMVRTRRWWFWGTSLKKPTTERVAVIAALTAFPGSETARRVLDVARASRWPEYRGAASRTITGTTDA